MYFIIRILCYFPTTYSCRSDVWNYILYSSG